MDSTMVRLTSILYCMTSLKLQNLQTQNIMWCFSKLAEVFEKINIMLEILCIKKVRPTIKTEQEIEHACKISNGNGYFTH